MNHLSGPLRSLVHAVTWFPEAFQPGVFVVALITIGWIVVVHGRQLWNVVCQAVAVTVDVVIGCLLLPEYLVTSARRRLGHEPSPITLAAGAVVERALDGAAVLYSRH